MIGVRELLRSPDAGNHFRALPQLSWQRMRTFQNTQRPGSSGPALETTNQHTEKEREFITLGLFALGHSRKK